MSVSVEKIISSTNGSGNADVHMKEKLLLTCKRWELNHIKDTKKLLAHI